MILKRLVESMRKREWSTLFVEIAILAIGVLIGLRVDAWNESRNDRIDEREFMVRLHSELETSFDLYRSNFQRGQERMENMLRAAQILAGQDGADTLSDEECRAIGASAFLVPNTFDLTSLEELIATGRFDIISNAELRFALIKVQQLSERTENTLTDLALTPAVLLSGDYPEIVQVQSYWDDSDKSVRLHWDCELPAMRNNQSFLNDFAVNVDASDALYRSTMLSEWNHLREVHHLVERLLENNTEDRDL